MDPASPVRLCVEHKLITGGEVYLPFARSRIKALRATGLAHASQQFEIDGCSVKVRIAPGHEYITLSGNPAYVSAFPSVQYPETDVVEASPTKVPGAKFITGSFPATFIDPAIAGQGIEAKTSFGTNPYNLHHLRRTRAITQQSLSSIPTSLVSRTGVIIGGTQRYSVFADGALQEEVEQASPYLGNYVRDNPPEVGGGSSGHEWATRTSEPAHCIASGASPVLATLEVMTEETKYTRLVRLEADQSGETYYTLSESGTATTSGTSWLQLRILRSAVDAGGQPTRQYKTLGVGLLPYAYASAISSESKSDGFYHVDTWKKITNDIECTLNYRRWHALERISAAPDGSVFVLRETSALVSDDRYHHAGNTSFYDGFTASAVRGYALSHVSAQDVVRNNVITGDLGAYGYLDGIIPSASGKKAYVYYGLHDASETLPAVVPGNFSHLTPVLFTEHLDEITVTVGVDGSPIFTKTRTVNLGAVTLRKTAGLGKIETDHYASKLHGASLAAGGFIWADRFCYDLKDGVFLEIPSYAEMVPQIWGAEEDASRDQITGPKNDRSTYVRVAGNGKSAVYVLIKFGVALEYRIGVNAETGAKEVQAGGSWLIPINGSDQEDLSAAAAQFPMPSGVR